MATTTYIAGLKTVSDFLVALFNPVFNNRQVTVGTNQTLEPGAVVGRITTGGLIVALNPGASDGSQNVYGIMNEYVATTASTAPASVLERGPAVVRTDGLVFGGGVTAPQRAAAIAALDLKNIIAK
jgi:Bacteriophage lambda head decoration protein D